jgi:hypothetical protein
MGKQFVRRQFATLQKASINSQSFWMTAPGGGCGPRLLKRGQVAVELQNVD